MEDGAKMDLHQGSNHGDQVEKSILCRLMNSEHQESSQDLFRLDEKCTNKLMASNGMKQENLRERL